VDDQAFIGVAVRQLLAGDPDFAFHHCTDPREAVAMANRIHPSVILQDLVMPGIDGLTVMQAFRANPSTADTPVIVLSGNVSAESRRQSLDHGAVDYLVKLPSREHLIACLRHYAAKGSAATLPSAHVAPGAAAPAHPWAVTPSQRQEQTLDPAALAAFREADPDGSSGFVRVLIDQFLEDATSQVAALGHAVQQSDTPALEAVAHSLKGSAATMGAVRLAALCGQLEHHAARPAGGRVASLLLAEIEAELMRVRAALEAERAHT
jgi:CheY-like chemotaxis protein/HPt (histidine-containing phosphotransfer) domain-containing protein